MSAPVKVEERGDISLISLADPATLNAMSIPMVEALDAALAAAADHSRAIILTGEGRGFCSGANLGGSLDPTVAAYDAGAFLASHFNPLMQRIRDLRIPIVTAVNGAAAGIGATIALSGDLIVASANAYFMQAFRRIGLVPDGGSAFLLVHAAGRVRAMEMMLLGERVGAAQALEWGLINRVVPESELQAKALTLAEALATGPASLGLIRRLGWEATERGFTDMLGLEREMQREAGCSADHREGVKAFLEKRPAIFKGN